ncbi:MAG: hypothetical protein RIG62_25180 [Cyclobacteriaceae bacterium]
MKHASQNKDGGRSSRAAIHPFAAEINHRIVVSGTTLDVPMCAKDDFLPDSTWK